MTLQKDTNIKHQINSFNCIEIDLSNSIKILLPKLTFKIEDFASKIITEDFEINSEKIFHHQTINRPKWFKAYKTNDLKILRFIRYSDFISTHHPYISLESNVIEYTQILKEQPIAEYFWRLRESKAHNAFLISLSNQNITLLDSNLNILHQYESSKFCKGNYDLRTIEMTDDLSLFCFTCIDKAYILNKDFEILVSFQVPHKDNFEKRNRNNLIDTTTQKHLDILGLKYSCTQKEIKSAFRQLITIYHPDKNPDLKEAEEKAKELINSYEYLSGQKISNFLDGNNDADLLWINKKHSYSTYINGIKFEINLDLECPEDWIYGSGFSLNNSMVYLGCYSGKVYETNLDGKVNKTYIIPEDENTDRAQRTNPISYIFDLNDIKYILSHYYLYILVNDEIINYIKCDHGRIRWFDDGIIKQLEKEIILFDNKGNLFGNIIFKTPIKYICYNKGLLLIELTSKTITFKLKSPITPSG